MSAFFTTSFLIWLGAAVLWIGAGAVAWHVYVPHHTSVHQAAAVELSHSMASTTASSKTLGTTTSPIGVVKSSVTVQTINKPVVPTTISSSTKLKISVTAPAPTPTVPADDESALINAQTSVRSAVRNAYIVGNNAVNNTADAFFTGASVNPQLAFFTPNAEVGISLGSQMVRVSALFPPWEKEVFASSFNTATDTAALATQAENNLNAATSLLNNLFAGFEQATTLSISGLTSDKTNVTNAELNVSNAYAAVVSAEASEQQARAAIQAALK